MKLSEAIMMNGMTKPQGYGCDSIMSCDVPCALGGALQVIGRQDTHCVIANYRAIKDSWPWTFVDTYMCPVCKGETTAVKIIWQLNDVHHWTRQQIVEWVAFVEPAELSEPEVTEETLCNTQK